MDQIAGVIGIPTATISSPVASTAVAAAPLLDVVRRSVPPVHLLAADAESVIDSLASSVPFLHGKHAQAGLPTAYVCQRGGCDLPLSDAAALAALSGRIA